MKYGELGQICRFCNSPVFYYEELVEVCKKILNMILVCQDDLWLNKQIGIRGLEMKHELLGEMVSPVSNEVKLPKSIQKTSALAKFSSDKNYLKNSLNYHIHRACVKLRGINAKCKGVSIFLRTKDFRVFCPNCRLKNVISVFTYK